MNQESEDAAFFGVVGNPTTAKNCGIVDRLSLRRPRPSESVIIAENPAHLALLSSLSSSQAAEAR